VEKLFVDTNIVLDLLAKREIFFEEAQILFSRADKKQIKIYISSLTFANMHYILSRNIDEKEVRNVLRKFKVLVNVLPMNDKVLDLALSSKLKDFEDAIQYYTAIENGIKIIITRNLKDFKFSNIPVMTAKEYIVRNK
jgi:predicted nucleic acid-binding protein